MLIKQRVLLFSLIELFIVIAVLLLLITLVSPSLERVFQNAHQVNCKNNLKQLSIAKNLYADDYNNFFAPIHGHVAGVKKLKDWNEILNHIGLYPATDPSTFCPSPSEPQSYGLNTTPYNGGKLFRINRPLNRNLIEDPSEKLHGGDCTDILTYSGRADPQQSLGWMIYGETSFRSLAYRHDQKALVFYFDGHVDYFEMESFQHKRQQFYYNKFALAPIP